MNTESNLLLSSVCISDFDIKVFIKTVLNWNLNLSEIGLPNYLTFWLDKNKSTMNYSKGGSTLITVRNTFANYQIIVT